jgi:hypothetical protein
MTLLITSDQGKKQKRNLRHDLDISIYYTLAQLGPHIWHFARAIKFFVKTRQLSRKSRDVVGLCMSPTLKWK